jgi:hypothetical protein
MENEKKIRKSFTCDKCDYHTCDSKDFKKHLSTRKHLGNESEIRGIPEKSEVEIEVDEDEKFLCENCNKVYHTQSGLWKHKKKCTVSSQRSLSQPEPKNVLTPSSAMLPEGGITAEFILEVIQQNKLLQENNRGLLENAKGLLESNKGLQESNKELQNFIMNKLSDVTAQSNTNSHNIGGTTDSFGTPK